jgi:poly(3-hydroxybutyrate) depolymerase
MPKRSITILLVTLALGLGRVLSAQVGLEESWEKRINADQPPVKVLDAIGVKPGMVIGEVGAGRGRYTVQLAARVGRAGKILAEDIDQASLDYLQARCRRNEITNVEIIRGTVDDPLFPRGSLDMAFMILTYHHLADPVALLRRLVPALKPGANVAIVDPDPIKDPDRSGRESTSREKMEREAGQAGFEILRVEDFLKNDNIFILRAKPALLSFPPRSKERTALIDEYRLKAQGAADRFGSFVYKNAGGETMPYRLFTPSGREPGRTYPLVVFLHGAGGSGTDNVKQLEGANVFGGLVWALPENQARHPCYILAPQSNVNWPCVIIEQGARPRLCPGRRLGDGARLALEILDKLAPELAVDKSRIYVTGHSMGGAGVWHMIARRPGYFAAAVPVCGLPDFSDAALMKGTPIWSFNGELDPIEPAAQQRRWIDEVLKAGASPIYTEYAGVEHEAFMWAYTEPGLVEWLFAQHR